MHAIRIHSYGGPDVLQLDEVTRPEPKPGEFLVRVKAAGVNPVDWKIRKGEATFLKLHLPVTLGCDLAGTLENSGGGFHTGDEVYASTALMRNGAFAEYAIVLDGEIALKPKSLGFVEASSIPVAALTAWQSIFDDGNLESGQTILIHGASGAVGSMAVQLAKWKGAHVIGTASGDNVEYVRSIGADEVVDYRMEKFEDKARDVDLVFDTVGGETQTKSFAVLRDGGTLISTVQPPSEDLAKQHGVKAKMVNVSPNGQRLVEIAKLIDSGKLQSRVGQVFSLGEAVKALALVESGKAKGKVVLEVG